MEWFYWIKGIGTVLIVLLGTNWLFNTFFLDLKRDFSSVALQQQSNIGSVRKENETAYYRNFLVPLGFPLITGLGLSLKYKIRNGNFADVWKAIMELAEKNTIRFTDEPKEYTLDVVNGMAKHFLKTQLSEEYMNVGIAVSPSTLPGFVITIASMMGSIEQSSVPHFLAAVPRQRIDSIDVLIIDSWRAYRMLNGSEKWYKLVIVCEARSSEAAYNVHDNTISWDESIEGFKKDAEFEYTPPADNSDDSKFLAFTTSSYNATTSFAQRCLVSGIASFIQGFPSGQELSNKDSLAVVGNLGDVSSSIHFWHKAFAVLLHCGSLSFINKPSISLSSLSNSTLLFIEPSDLVKIVEEINSKGTSFTQRLRLSWATALLSEGVFTKVGQAPFKSLNKLRCVLLAESIQDTQSVAAFPEKIPKLKETIKSKSFSSFTTEKLNYVRALLGSRVILELYCPYIVMGPISQTNYYDYRVLPSSVDSCFTCCGPLATTLEGKLTQTDENPQLDISKRQGMLCIRGFTIGKPVESNRLQDAMKLSDKFGGGEGWMPMVGIFGLWGQDGCLYIYK